MLPHISHRLTIFHNKLKVISQKNANKSASVNQHANQLMLFIIEKLTQVVKITLSAWHMLEFVQLVMNQIILNKFLRNHNYGKKSIKSQIQVHSTQIPLSQIQAKAKLIWWHKPKRMRWRLLSGNRKSKLRPSRRSMKICLAFWLFYDLIGFQ